MAAEGEGICVLTAITLLSDPSKRFLTPGPHGRGSDDALAGQVAHVSDARERHQMVLAERVDGMRHMAVPAARAAVDSFMRP
jgi:hypothetical protein